MPALGTDIGGVNDVDRFLTMVDGPRAAAEAVAVSLLHNDAILWWAPERGHAVHRYLHREFDAEAVEQASVAEAEKDERVESAEATAELFGTELRLEMVLTLTQDEERVTLTLNIDQVAGVLAATVA